MELRNFTREQKECVSAHHLQVSRWKLLKETEFYLVIINGKSGQRMWIDKFTRRRTSSSVCSKPHWENSDTVNYKKGDENDEA